MLSSSGIQPCNSANLLRTLLKPYPSLFPPNTHRCATIPIRKRKSSAFSTSSATTEMSTDTTNNQARKKLRVLVKPIESLRLVLKFIWMEEKIGIAINQVIPGGNGTIPLSPYYFWPKSDDCKEGKDAWDDIKLMLESKPWISQYQLIVLLNQATDIINLWDESRQLLS